MDIVLLILTLSLIVIFLIFSVLVYKDIKYQLLDEEFEVLGTIIDIDGKVFRIGKYKKREL